MATSIMAEKDLIAPQSLISSPILWILFVHHFLHKQYTLSAFRNEGNEYNTLTSTHTQSKTGAEEILL